MIEELAIDFIENNAFVSEDEAINESLVGLKLYDAPVVCYADANDELFEQFRSVHSATYGHFKPPKEWLPEAKTVVSIFFPYTAAVKNANAKDMRFPANEWLHGRVEGQNIINHCTQYLLNILHKQGYKAIAPSLDERFKASMGLDVEDQSKLSNENFYSNWSERHTAFAAGQGTFSLSKGLITSHGVAGRFSSIITDYKYEPTVRNYHGLYEYCTMCGKCVKNCPVKAISKETGKNHIKCRDFVGYTRKKDGARFGCGKCQVGVPCESRIPVSVRAAGTAEALSFLFPESLWKSLPGLNNSDKLTGLAEKAMTAPLVSVTDKPELPPSGDKRDYCSLATYFWRNSDTPDGLPWIRKDGLRNPEIDLYDRKRLEVMIDNAVALILAGHSTEERKYAEHAGTILKHWFLDKRTGMRPNLEFAQFIPGVCDGRGIGIIDTGCLVYLLDAISHLPFNTNWTKADLDALKQWFSDYVDWMLDSQNGIDECNTLNNHGTWYDVQIVAFSVFADRPETAVRQLEKYTVDRAMQQITDDGRQPHEIARTLSLNYSTYNLLAFFILSHFANKLGIDFQEVDAKLQQALNFLQPYLELAETWPYEQIKPFNRKIADRLDALLAEKSPDWRALLLFSE